VVCRDSSGRQFFTTEASKPATGGRNNTAFDDEDYCPDGDSESFYEGCIAYVRGMADQADNGVGVGTLINPDADDDDDNK
jgi:hypothetical protein